MAHIKRTIIGQAILMDKNENLYAFRTNEHIFYDQYFGSKIPQAVDEIVGKVIKAGTVVKITIEIE